MAKNGESTTIISEDDFLKWLYKYRLKTIVPWTNATALIFMQVSFLESRILGKGWLEKGWYNRQRLKKFDKVKLVMPESAVWEHESPDSFLAPFPFTRSCLYACPSHTFVNWEIKYGIFTEYEVYSSSTYISCKYSRWMCLAILAWIRGRGRAYVQYIHTYTYVYHFCDISRTNWLVKVDSKNSIMYVHTVCRCTGPGLGMIVHPTATRTLSGSLWWLALVHLKLLYFWQERTWTQGLGKDRSERRALFLAVVWTYTCEGTQLIPDGITDMIRKVGLSRKGREWVESGFENEIMVLNKVWKVWVYTGKCG